jgi:sulfur relay (sulfurtransferase) DsrF/TusC family protein
MEKDFQSTLAIIKTRGYWKIHIYPNSTDFVSIEPINKGKEIIRSASVQFRGWDYPHFPTQVLDYQNIYTTGDKVEAWIDYNQFKEIWRFYDTSQFIHLFSLREDWLKEDSWLSQKLKVILPGAVLEMTGTIYSITEMYAFIRNLIQARLYKNEIAVEITLFGTKGRKLSIFDTNRMPLIEEHKSMMDMINFPKKVYKIQELETNYLDLAFEQIVYLFHQFNWDNPNIEAIKEDQRKLIERRL